MTHSTHKAALGGKEYDSLFTAYTPSFALQAPKSETSMVNSRALSLILFDISLGPISESSSVLCLK